MTRLIVLATVFMLASGPVGAADSKGKWAVVGAKSCQQYLDAYAKATLTGEGTITGHDMFHKLSGWVNGFISAYNFTVKNGKKSTTAGMSINDNYRWIASWCRDNSSKDIADATIALIHKMER